MAIGYHIILSAYGFWLPNDPRGSWSWIVRKPELREFGPATKVATHRSVAGDDHDRIWRLQAKEALDFPPVRFDDHQVQAIGNGIGDYSLRSRVTFWACAIMPDHAHFVVAPHTYRVEQVANLMKGAATRQLLEENRHPFGGKRTPKGDPYPCFARKWWVVFLDTDDDIERTVYYVGQNPVKAGLPEQRWSFPISYPNRLPLTSGPKAPSIVGAAVNPR